MGLVDLEQVFEIVINLVRQLYSFAFDIFVGLFQFLYLLSEFIILHLHDGYLLCIVYFLALLILKNQSSVVLFLLEAFELIFEVLKAEFVLHG